jgi:ribonuclease R
MSKLIVNNLGFGFINLEDKTIFIPKKKLNGAMNGDLVEYEIEDSTNNVANISKIVLAVPDYGHVSHIYQGSYVVKTARKQYYFKEENHNLTINDFLKIENNNININYGNKDLFVNKLKFIKDKYKINTIEFEKDDNTPIKIEDFDILGDIESRRDLRDLYTFTIDPTTSKDFDDAISISFENDIYTVGIHIADVSYYIKKDSELDKYAKMKMNSVYLNGDTVHMLPTILSNNLCSLVPNQDRNAVTVMAKFDKNGNQIDYEIFRSKINSKKRYTYQDVRKQINELTLDDHLRNLYNFITSKYPETLLQFNMPIVNISINDSKTPEKIELEDYDMSHIMIEKCMILANEIVAEDLNNKNLFFPYRCHPEPSKEQLEKYQIQKNYADNYLYQEIIKIKSYKNAYYSSNNISHYGLSSNKYCHFTSPIRRYVDIVVHRVLLGESVYSQEEINEICEKANNLETEAFKAEMELLDMQKEYLINLDSKELQNVIVLDVNKYGITVELLDYLIEKKIHISKLDENKLEFDHKNKRIYNDNKNIKIGDIIKIKIN